MAGSDVLGYPPNAFRRQWLTHYWNATFGATDIGVPDFPTLEEFLRNNADRTYEDSKRLLLSFASSDVLADLKSISDEEARLESVEEEHLVEELSKVEVGEMALDKIRRQKEENEKLKAEIAELKKHPRKKAERKAKPLTAFPSPAPEKTPTDYITKLCKQSPLSQAEKTKLINTVEIHDIEAAIKIIKECPADTLDNFDKFELEERLRQKEMGVIPQKETTDRQLHKMLYPVMKPREKPRISTGTTRRKAREGTGEGEGEGEGEEFVPTRRYQFTNLADANDFFKEFGASVHEMVHIGVPEWIETRKKAAVGKLNTQAVISLGNALEYAMVPPHKPNLRDLIAMDFIHKTKWMIVEHGIEFGAREFDWKKPYSFYKNLPADVEQLKKDVIQSVKGLQFIFGKQ